jgi:hypothetical protein
MRHFSDQHHQWWPAAQYAGGIAKVFRELPEYKEQRCRNEHQELHATQAPPIKPERAFMIQAIARHLERELGEINGQGEMAG